jgi:hypothetical protein
MADIVHARDELAAASPRPSKSTTKPTSSPNLPPAGRVDKPPRTDIGTLTLHWATAIAFLVSLFTGIRIAADALNAPFSHWLNKLKTGSKFDTNFVPAKDLWVPAFDHVHTRHPRPVRTVTQD